MNVLVTGGAGYIGSHTVVELLNAGHKPILVDDLSNAKADVIDRIETITGTRPSMYVLDCKRFVFSSSATVYGHNPYPYKEEMKAIKSSSPYGWTKVMIERILTDYCTAHPDFCAILLRYFNPIGSHESGLLGDDPNGIPNNLMPYIGRVAAGQLEKLTIFGDDYPTHNGTCQRDYLHVVDLAIGHLKALEYAENYKGVEAINLGSGADQFV